MSAYPASVRGRKPRVVRNFWIEADIDGRDSRLVGGPQPQHGGFDLTIKQRDTDGDGNVMVTTAYEIMGRANGDGTLSISIRDSEDNLVSYNVTDRDVPNVRRP